MRIAMVVPGGVDRSGEYRVIPALLALITRLSHHNDVQVIALSQEARAGEWDLAGARIHNVGLPCTGLRALLAIYKMHRAAPFDVVHAIWSGTCGLVAAIAGTALGIPSLVHVAGGELVSLPEIGYGGAQTRLGRLREALVLRRVSAVTAASDISKAETAVNTPGNRRRRNTRASPILSASWMPLRCSLRNGPSIWIPRRGESLLAPEWGRTGRNLARPAGC